MKPAYEYAMRVLSEVVYIWTTRNSFQEPQRSMNIIVRSGYSLRPTLTRSELQPIWGKCFFQHVRTSFVCPRQYGKLVFLCSEWVENFPHLRQMMIYLPIVGHLVPHLPERLCKDLQNTDPTQEKHVLNHRSRRLYGSIPGNNMS